MITDSNQVCFAKMMGEEFRKLSSGQDSPAREERPQEYKILILEFKRSLFDYPRSPFHRRIHRRLCHLLSLVTMGGAPHQDTRSLPSGA